MGLIPPFFFDCIVALGLHPEGEEFRGIASGFLFGRFEKEEVDGKRTYSVFLVSNRHVFKDMKQLWVRFNPEKLDEPAREYIIALEVDGKQRWYAHPNTEIDIATVLLRAHILREHHIKFAYFQNDLHIADTKKLVEIGTMEDDSVYVLGFPLGIVGKMRNAVIARKGIIARISDTLIGRNQQYLIDASFSR